MYTSLTHLSAYAPESGAWLAILPLVQGAAAVGGGRALCSGKVSDLMCVLSWCGLETVSSSGLAQGRHSPHRLA